MTKDFYGVAQRHLQEARGTRRLADAVAGAIVHDTLTEDDRGFIQSRDFFFLATADADGWPTTSYKGGAPGFVRALDDRTLVFPSYDGNGMFLSMGNIEASSKIGMLFIDFETPHRLRVQATAAIHDDAGLLASYPGAQLLVRASIAAIFVNCPRYIHTMSRVAPSAYVPDAEGKAPLPAWKRIDAMQEVLPSGDQGRAAVEGGLISMEDYAELVRAGKA
ncbi:MAG: pyridoxamine 5'-phosphate oxidase family protein [Hyphomicrobiaceae bacterium]|nr:pyridoxamine 5'-phosphate oxidase family protein [Hyphomicrobiaceae bacterium]